MEIDKAGLDRKIEELANKSKDAPKEFLVPEMRRFLSMLLGRYPHFMFYENDFHQIMESMETEYKCYFETDNFRKECECTRWWKRTYAGCNSQIEGFLADRNLRGALEKMGFTEKEFNPKTEIGKDEIPGVIRRYLACIGFLYPADDKLIVHPNMLLGQNGHALSEGDSPFLTRDIIRCPYHEESYGGRGGRLKENELWDYWKDLATLSIARLPEHIFYDAEHFREPSKRSKIIKEHLAAGRKLIPQRYVELKPKIEEFEWAI